LYFATKWYKTTLPLQVKPMVRNHVVKELRRRKTNFHEKALIDT